MQSRKERRLWPREHLIDPDVAILYPHYQKELADTGPGCKDDTLLVYVLNKSAGGVLLESPHVFEEGFVLDMRIWFADDNVWLACQGKVAWTNRNADKEACYYLGVEFQPAAHAEKLPGPPEEIPKRRMCPRELEFLMQTRFLNVIPREIKCTLLNSMVPRHLRAGERLISQGDEGDNCYIVQDGNCIVKIEKDGTHYPIARVKAGDIVGEMALLTGARRSAHVDAETDMTVWSLHRANFDALCMENPDARDFLTEIVTNRFSTERMTAKRTIRKYVIEEILGRGGWSIVYKGTHTHLNMPVAIKMLKHTLAMDLDFAEKFRKEAKIVASLNHENIVKVYDIEELYRTIFIIMECLEGVSLENVLDKMPRLSLPRILDIILQVCAALVYAHEQGIIHQDIKPANIFIQSDDRVKILDFGLACGLGYKDYGWPGTAFYMSPEQIEGEPVDERTDIYSLGIMAYEMVTGQSPYPEDDPIRLMNLHVSEDVPDPRRLVPDMPAELHYFIKRASQRDPSGRFKTVWEILRDLQPFADRIGVKRGPYLGEQRKMMSLFLFYHDGHQLALNRLVEDFSGELKKLGAELRVADFKDV
jgi:CRP-like cAMP-binding protein